MAPLKSSTPRTSTPPLQADDLPPHLAQLADRFALTRQKAGRHALIYNRAIRVPPPPNPAVTRRTMSEPPMRELQGGNYEIWTTYFHMPAAHSRPSSPSNDDAPTAPATAHARESHPPQPLPAYPTPDSAVEPLNNGTQEHHPNAIDGMELDDDVDGEIEVKTEELEQLGTEIPPDVNTNPSPSRRSFASINALASESFEISVPIAPDALGLAQYDSLGPSADSQVVTASGPTHGNALVPLPSNASTISAWGSFGGHPPGFAAMLGNHIVTGPALPSSTAIATQTPSRGSISSAATESIRAPSPTPHPVPAPAPPVFSALRPAPLRSAMKRKRAADHDADEDVEVKIETEAPSAGAPQASSSKPPADSEEGSRPKKVPRLEPQASSPPASEAASPPPEASSSSGSSEAKPRRSDRLANRTSMIQAGVSSSAANSPKGKAKDKKAASSKRTRRSS